jgi:hypothetical protein
MLSLDINKNLPHYLTAAYRTTIYLEQFREMSKEFPVDRRSSPLPGGALFLRGTVTRRLLQRRPGGAPPPLLLLLRPPVVDPAGNGDAADVCKDGADIGGPGQAQPGPAPLSKFGHSTHISAAWYLGDLGKFAAV